MNSQTGSWLERREQYEQIVRTIEPTVRLVTKDHVFWRVAARLLWCLSLGKTPPRVFLEQYATTLGPLQAYPRRWPRLTPWLLVHESQHTVQCRRAGWFVPVLGWLGGPLRTWVGLLPMGFCYALLPLPVGLAWCRMRMELDADAAAWRAGLRNGWLTPGQVRARAVEFAEVVSGSAYLWSWPTRWTCRAFAARAERVIDQWQREEGREAGEVGD